MAVPSIPKIPVPVRGQQTGPGTNKFAALVEATQSLKPVAIHTMTPHELGL